MEGMHHSFKDGINRPNSIRMAHNNNALRLAHPSMMMCVKSAIVLEHL